MLLAKNNYFSLHKLNPDTYVHETYVLIERFNSTQECDYRITLFSAPKKEQKERLEKLIRSIENGANGANIELYPLHFVCGFPDYGKCPANERATALRELRLAEEQNWDPLLIRSPYKQAKNNDVSRIPDPVVRVSAGQEDL